MDKTKSVIKEEFDRSGRYEPGLKALARGLKLTFVFLLAVIVLLLVYLFTIGSYFAVEPQNAVIVMKFGKIEHTFDTGGHWFLPYPINRWVTVRTNPQTLMVDFLPGETFDGAPPQSLEPGRDSYLLTGDANIIHASWSVVYRVTSPETYYTALATPQDPSGTDNPVLDSYGFRGTRGPQTLIRNLFRESVIRVTAGRRVDDLLYDKQTEYSAAVLADFTQLMDEEQYGIKIDNVALERVFPPLMTKAAFDQVAAATSTSDSMISRARQYEIQTRHDTEARQNELINNAESYRTLIISQLEAESTYFKAINEEYQKNPRTVLMALYNSTLSEVLQQLQDQYILGTGSQGGRKQLRILLNPEPKRRTVDADAEENR